jgi:hypothetical protein
MKLGKTKRNLLLTKRNDTKFRKIFWFAKHAKFCKTDDEFRLVLCFAKLKKHAKLETQFRMLRFLRLCVAVFGCQCILVVLAVVALFVPVPDAQCFGSGSAFNWRPGSGSIFGRQIRIQEV